MRRRAPSGPPIIEIARAADEETVAALSLLIPQLGPGVDLVSPDKLARVIGIEGNTVLLARNPETRAIIGTLTLTLIVTPTGVGGWIADVVVDASARGSGSGEALVREALRIATEKGAHFVDLTSRPARVTANRLYQRLGFEKRHTNYYRYPMGGPENAVQRPASEGRTSK